jgi:hypothetical protein
MNGCTDPEDFSECGGDDERSEADEEEEEVVFMGGMQIQSATRAGSRGSRGLSLGDVRAGKDFKTYMW